MIRSYARREPEIDRVILAGFVLGLSTRKVGETLLAILGQKVSPSTVSRVARTLDQAVAAFHRRPLENRYTALMLDGVVLSRKTGAGALKRPVLVALGLRPDGKKEIIDFRLAASESAAEWERFLTDLYRRGLTNVIAISATMSSADLAAKTANTVANAYIEEQIEAKLSANDRASAVLHEGGPLALHTADLGPLSAKLAPHTTDVLAHGYNNGLLLTAAACVTAAVIAAVFVGFRPGGTRPVEAEGSAA